MALPRSFSSALRSTDPKVLDQRIQNGGQMQQYLNEGEHDVKVVGVDLNQLADNKLTIKYADDAGREHRDMIYLTAVNRKTGATELAWRFMGTLGMLIPDTEAYNALLAELDSNNEGVLELLVGLRGKIVLKRGDGYGPAIAQPDGSYVVTIFGPVFDPKMCAYSGGTIDEAQQAAEKAGYKKAFVNTDRYVAVADYKTTNVAQFSANLVATKSPQAKQNSPFRTAVAGAPGLVVPFGK
jgi:hypothetical protein